MMYSHNDRIRSLIGEEYLVRSGKSMQENSEHVAHIFREIVEINNELFNSIPFEVYFTTEDMYTSARHMRERVLADGVIYIYSGWSGHPFLTQEENNIGRAVHDVFAHLVCGCPFTFEGEYTAYLEQRKWYPKHTWDVLFAEIPAQTAAYYANGNSHEFSQRAISAPKKWVTLAESLILEDYSKNSVLDLSDLAHPQIREVV